MPIREESFRIGCGRYLQGSGILSKCGEEVLRLGTSPLVIGDETTLGLTREILSESFRQTCKKFDFYTHNGTCNERDAQAVASFAREQGFDVILGAGGGVLMDFAKLAACFAGVPVINLPTSSATCAAYAPLSVCYTPEGRTVGTRHYQKEVDAVLADTEILAKQPVRLLLAGVFDAMAKFVEIKHRHHGDLSGSFPLGLNYAYALAEHSFALLEEKTEPCIEAMTRGEITGDVENVIFTAIAATGVISGIARGSNQTALGHKFYETTRLLYPEASAPYLHGEIVGVGLILQNYYNGDEENNRRLLARMEKYGMPRRITDVGVPRTEEAFEEYYGRICNGSAIHKDDEAECARFRKSLQALWAL